MRIYKEQKNTEVTYETHPELIPYINNSHENQPEYDFIHVIGNKIKRDGTPQDDRIILPSIEPTNPNNPKYDFIHVIGNKIKRDGTPQDNGIIIPRIENDIGRYIVKRKNIYNIPDIIPTNPNDSKYDFVYVNGLKEIRQKANINKAQHILIQKDPDQKKKTSNLAIRTLQSLTTYEDSFKQPITTNNQLLWVTGKFDRSYIPSVDPGETILQSIFSPYGKRFQNYISGKFQQGKIQPYIHIRKNSSKTFSLGNYIPIDLQYDVFNYYVTDGVFIEKFTNTSPLIDNNYRDLRYPLLTQYEGEGSFFDIDGLITIECMIPIFKDLFNKPQKFNLLGFKQYSKLTIQEFKTKYLLMNQALTSANDVIINDRENDVKLNLKRFNLNNKYIEYNEDPIKASINNEIDYNKSEQNQQQRNVVLFKLNSTTDTRSEYIIGDPLAYQIQSYKTPIITADSKSQYNYDWTKGNVIKFWIQDVNNNRYMTTPAFMSSPKDSGLDGEWQQSKYAGGMYPGFLYKGTNKRTFSFDLKLACFDKKYLPEYIEKLNFLRLVGTPTYNNIKLPNNNIYSFPKAPIYKLTVGDIIKQQYGFFESCQFTWPDETAIWNLSKNKTYNKYIVGDNSGSLYQSIKDQQEIQIPLMTQMSITFTCIYGRGFSNTDEIYYNEN